MNTTLQVVLFVLSSSALASAGLVLLTFVQCRVALTRFKKLSKGLPFAWETCSWLGNHVLWPLSEQLCSLIDDYHKRPGCETVGWLYGKQFCVSTIDLDLIKKFIYDEPNKHINRVVANLPVEEFEQGIFLARDDKWRKLRRYFAPAFKPAKFKTPNVQHEIQSSIDKLIDHFDHQLDKKPAYTFELDDLVHRFVLSVVLSCFYKQYNLVHFDDDRKCHWTERVDEGLEAFRSSPFVKLAILFPQLRSTIDWLSWNFHSQGAWRRSIMHFVKLQTRQALEARKQLQELQARSGTADREVNYETIMLKDGSKFSRNMMDTVVDYYLDGKLTRDEFFNSSSFLVAASDKTVTDCLVHTLYLLGVHRDVQSRLRQTVQADGPEAEYLSWVLSESLRLMPPASIGCSRVVTRDFQLDNGHVLPADTYVVCCARTIHRLKKYWGEDADEFKPDRWRDTSHHHPMQYMPFGAGSRGCPGKEFALHEMKLALTALLTRYEFECEPKSDIDKFAAPFLIFMLPNSPTYLTVRRLED